MLIAIGMGLNQWAHQSLEIRYWHNVNKIVRRWLSIHSRGAKHGKRRGVPNFGPFRVRLGRRLNRKDAKDAKGCKGMQRDAKGCKAGVMGF
jgi:hypothetical protein